MLARIVFWKISILRIPWETARGPTVSVKQVKENDAWCILFVYFGKIYDIRDEINNFFK